MKLKLLLITSLLAGCASTPDCPVPDPVVVTKFLPLSCGTPPNRAPIDLSVISWQVRDERWSLSDDGYSDLSRNTSEIKRALNELKSEVQFYVRCLEEQGNDEIQGNTELQRSEPE